MTKSIPKPNIDGYYYFEELYKSNCEPTKGDKVIYCKKHKELTKIEIWEDDCNDYQYEYCCKCIYCVLDDGLYTSSDTYTIRIIECGYNDYNRNVNYLDICEPFNRIADILFFRSLYKFGYKYAEKKYDKNILNILSEYSHCID